MNCSARGCIYYDGECAFCRRWIGGWRGTLERHGFETAPLQGTDLPQQLNLSPKELLYDLRLLTREGEVISGADLYLYVARRIWWAWPFYAVFNLPGLNWFLKKAYRRFADNRYCIAGSCRLNRHA